MLNSGLLSSGSLNLGQRGANRFIVAFGAIDPEAFVEALDVGREVGAGAQPGGEQDRFDGGNRRTLAIGAGNGENNRRGPGKPHAAGNLAHAVEAEIDLPRMRQGDMVQPVRQLHVAG